MLERIRQGLAMRAARAWLGTLQVIGKLVGHLMFAGRANGARITGLNLSLAYPECDTRTLHRLAYSNLCECGKLMLELAAFWVGPGGWFVPVLNEVRGEQLIRRAQDAGQGVIVVTPHLGNWEMFNIPFVRYSMAGLYKPTASRWLDRWVRHRRERFGGRLIPLTAAGLRRLCAHLNDAGLVVALPDQVPGPESGRVQAPFFGVPAWTGTLIPRLIQRCNVAVIFGYARRESLGRGFTIELESAPTEVYSDDPQRAAAALNAGMERLIRRCPEQYLWKYKRYKHTLYPRLYDRSRPYRSRP